METIDLIVMENLTLLRNKILQMKSLESQLFKKNNKYGLILTLKILFPFFSFIIFCPFLIKSFGYIVILPLWIALGIYGYKISFVIHDCVHNTLFSNKKINSFIGYFCGLLTVSNYPLFVKHHLKHHSHTGTRNDPDYLEAFRFNKEKTLKSKATYLFSPLIGSRVLEYFSQYLLSHNNNSSISFTKKDFFWAISVFLVQLLIAMLISGFLRYPYLIFLYPLSGATISLFLGRCRFLSEHGQFGNEPANFARSHLPDFFDKLILYDAHFNYHLEHHLFPHMPSCHLPEFYNKYYSLVHSGKTLGKCMRKTLLSLILKKY